MKGSQVLERLRKSGYKITPQRQEILNALLGSGINIPQSAEEIHKKVIEKYPHISLDTVYRNLQVLTDLEIVSKLNLQDGKNRYELNYGEHHHHLICLKCGAAEAIEFCPFKSVDIKKIEEEKKFEIRRHSFELFGYCKICRHQPEGTEPGTFEGTDDQE
ncbi:Fe2+/Zn2+ uptake regulation proteins [Pelotomaculum thermopropionicum SI]|uniref:Fe2+/Zn2+ uptake regulation proteins n=1 Tax=Pelotomaculum thermopropionicum (strain DSM 13744 / JCM 10971 / SI) TaxID=370438 RepID=A5D2H9_PELTS|nr:Fe2+/Zn2+ uptake regulation proteins [Pelotomaculum thermopropionicum SI]